MADASTGSPLARLRFVDPQREPGWRHDVVPAATSAATSADAGDRTVLARTGDAVRSVEVLGAGRSWTLEEWLTGTWATSLLVLADGEVVHAWYADGAGPGTAFLGASMTKSALAHLVGRAVTDGALRLDSEVCALVPELAGSGYERTRVLDVLTMTSGVDWVEDHRDPGSLASRLVGCFADGGDSRALLASVRPGVAPATRWSYCTADSQVLDWVRERATGRTFVEDLGRLWRDLGCTTDARVGVDGRGVALAGGGLAATTRDWGRIGALMVSGRTGPDAHPAPDPVLDPAWVEAAARPAYPFTAPGRLPSTISTHVGFGRHWWPLDTDGRRVAADGSRGQLLVVDRRTGAVAVRTSQWPYGDAWEDRQHRDLCYLGLQALLDACDPTPEPNPDRRRHREP